MENNDRLKNSFSWRSTRWMSGMSLLKSERSSFIKVIHLWIFSYLRTFKFQNRDKISSVLHKLFCRILYYVIFVHLSSAHCPEDQTLVGKCLLPYITVTLGQTPKRNIQNIKEESVFIGGSEFSTTVRKNKKGDVMRKRLFCFNEGSRNGLCMIHTGSHGNVF